MALLHNPGIALTLATKTQRQAGNWTPLTSGQIAEIGRVIDDDRHGRLTRAEIVARLTAIGTPTEAA